MALDFLFSIERMMERSVRPPNREHYQARVGAPRLPAWFEVSLAALCQQRFSSMESGEDGIVSDRVGTEADNSQSAVFNPRVWERRWTERIVRAKETVVWDQCHEV